MMLVIHFLFLVIVRINYTIAFEHLYCADQFKNRRTVFNTTKVTCIVDFKQIHAIKTFPETRKGGLKPRKILSRYDPTGE